MTMERVGRRPRHFVLPAGVITVAVAVAATGGWVAWDRWGAEDAQTNALPPDLCAVAMPLLDDAMRDMRQRQEAVSEKTADQYTAGCELRQIGADGTLTGSVSIWINRKTGTPKAATRRAADEFADKPSRLRFPEVGDEAHGFVATGRQKPGGTLFLWARSGPDQLKLEYTMAPTSEAEVRGAGTTFANALLDKI